MAPPRNRRPGFSRRIQFSLFIGYVAAIVGMVLALGLFMASALDPVGFARLRGLSVDIGAPFSRIGQSMVGTADGVERGIKAYFFAGSQNNALRERLADMRRRLIKAEALRHENMRLKKMLHLSEPEIKTVVTTRILGSGLSTARRFATISAGTKKGVRPGQPVRTADGLAGRVLESGLYAARVLLVTDPDSTIPVRLLRTGAPSLSRGQGDGTLRVTSLVPGARPFRRGDLVETSGTGGIYPPHIPVAVIARVEGDSAVALPLADPEALDFAIVMQPYLLPHAPDEAGAP